MDTSTKTIDRETLFAFAHGIRITLESLDIPFNDENVVKTILGRMDDILGSAKYSLVRGHDDLPDWDDFRNLREIEQKLCFEYLTMTLEENEEENENEEEKTN